MRKPHPSDISFSLRGVDFTAWLRQPDYDIENICTPSQGQKSVAAEKTDDWIEKLMPGH